MDRRSRCQSSVEFDPDDLSVTPVTGLVSPYTYPDMTGGVLQSIVPEG